VRAAGRALGRLLTWARVFFERAVAASSLFFSAGGGKKRIGKSFSSFFLRREKMKTARQCAVCKNRYHNNNSFELVCFCENNQGICHACFVLSGMDKKTVAEIRDYGWAILGKNHAAQRRSSQSTDANPMFKSMMMQDPVVQRNIGNFFAGRPMEPSPYAVYVSPALQADRDRKEKERQDLIYALVFLVATLAALFFVYKMVIH
jgi:hypothetical protein